MMRFFALMTMTMAMSACAGEVDETRSLAPSGDVRAAAGAADGGSCPGVFAGIAPTTESSYSCGALDPQNAAIAADVNRFWGSQVVGCGCGADFPNGCEGAFSLFTEGYIYLGVDFVNGLAASGSLMPAYYVFAHEMGHEIEGHFNAFAPTTQQRELTADCLAGYYLGSLICRGVASEQDLVTTLRTACIIADGTGDPIADRDSHGTCQQRAGSLATGMQAYLTNTDALAACAL